MNIPSPDRILARFTELSRHVVGVALLAGIGFTMSIFIAILSFNDILHINEAKLSVLLTSIIAGLAGYFLLRNTKMKYKDS